MYKYIIDSFTRKISTSQILRIYDNAYIPFDLANNDYKQYVEWLSEGNTPLPPDQE